MHEKHKANQNLQRRKKQRREKKQGRKSIKLKENYPKLYDGSLLFKIFVKKLLILVDDLNILLKLEDGGFLFLISNKNCIENKTDPNTLEMYYGYNAIKIPNYNDPTNQKLENMKMFVKS